MEYLGDGDEQQRGGDPPLRDGVDAACREEGRDPATLKRTATVLIEFPGSVTYPPGYPGWRPGAGRPLSGSPEELAEVFRAYAREGIAHLLVWVNPATVAGLEALAPVLEILDRD